MTKKILLPILLLFAYAAQAQLNNSWIDYSKTYYKFKIAADNITRIPQTAVAFAGLAATNADHFQLWRNGQQVRLFTSVTGAPLASGDFIEFWGEMNDGKADATLYKKPQFQLADRFSLETDTANYFLTVNSEGGNLRYTTAVNNAPVAATPDAYFMRNIDVYYRDNLNRGYARDLGEYVYSSAYDAGEGYTTGEKNIGTPFTQTLTGLNVFTGGASNSLSIRAKVFSNTDNIQRKITLRLFSTSISSIVTSHTSEALFNVTGQPLSLLQNTSTADISIANSNISNPVVNDRFVVATVGITYPATFNFNNSKSFSFELAAASGNYLVIDNFNYGTTAPVLYDINNGTRYVGDIASTPGKVKFLLPASTDPIRKFILNNVESANIAPVSTLTAKNFINYNTPATRGDYVIISNPVLYNDGAGVNNVELYRAYRSSANGGGYNAKVYDINELTDQFGFGIKSHPTAIRDFVRFMDVQYPTKPKFIFIIGRGVTYQGKRPNESNPIAAQLDLVGTFGWPASDVLLTSQPGATLQITPVGRLGAISGTEVGIYLQKVLQYETAQRTQSPLIADKDWMKKMIHIVGGKTEGESTQLGDYMDQYKAIAEDTLYGGDVETFRKTSVATVQQASSARISELFQQGLGFVGYFGHSSATTFEFNISDPSNYNNPGKYPFFNASGCIAGDFYSYDPARLLGGTTLTEKYIFANQRGSIGFLADTHFGIPFALNNYNKRFYKNFSLLMYGASVGQQLKEVNAFLDGADTTSFLNYFTRIHLEQINLNGDPAVKINAFPKADYVIEEPSVVVSPNVISVADPFFNVKVNMRNIGKAVNDSIRVSVKRLLPNATVAISLMDTIIPAIKFADSLNLNVPINPATDNGLNKIIVEVDWTNRVNEVYETNNKVTKDVFIFENTLNPVYPYNYSIVNNQNITFSASTANPLIPVSTYIMEIDTTELFNSAFKKTYNTSSIGGVIQFTPTNLTLTDSTVYYWRTSVVPTTGNNIWNTFSFVYLPASTPGFNQSHYYQFLKNQYSGVNLGADRVFKYAPRSIPYNIRTAVYPNSSQQDDYSITNGGFVEQNGLAAPFGSNNNALRFYIIDTLTLKPLFNQTVGTAGLYGSNNPIPINSGQTAGYFQFSIITASQRQVVKQFLDNNIAPGNIIVMVNCPGNVNTHYPLEWSTDPGSNLYTTLKAMGFSQIDQITSHVPFVFAVKKGSNVPITQTVGVYADLLNVPFIATGVSLSGEITSDVFGPAKMWNELHWRGRKLEVANNDRTAVSIIGLNITGTEDILATVNPANDTTLSWINPITYPRLRLKMLNADSTTATPNQLKYWLINGEMLPEGAVAPNIRYNMKDTVEIGEPINFSVAFKNISLVKFDSLMQISLKIRTASNFDSIINIPRGKILIAGDTLVASYTIPSEKYPGKNTLFIDFNPNYAQPEQSRFNNILYKDFFVKSDPFNPLLDVTFDGVHILSRDIVASKPAILIKLKDENRFLALKDTGLLKVQLRYPDQTLRNISFGDTMRFNPANLSAGENAATIDFKPFLQQDGEYELIVSGKDVAGNSAGALNYRTVFSVINKPMISELLNYPNPFTTSTAFVFTLTGSQVPQNMRIQILTITGKVVREITKQELGPIHIGRNITDFKWDGTDMYGQQLANGVYIYRVITNLNGKSLDKYKADGDNTGKYFNKGYGKMYLMR
ncbi:MAG: C25 family cysteine peptidase [Ferruginibacter sp.]